MKARAANRRNFIKLCGAALTAVSARPDRLALANTGPQRSYNRVELVLPDGTPLRSTDLQTGRSYVFHYPHVTTPCFLLKLDGVDASRPVELETADGVPYRWHGGTGPDHSIVAFSAICAHKMSHPAQQVSFISYRSDTASFLDSEKKRQQREQVIYCCSEKSVYDPANGARVLGGPAPQPLATVVLDYDPSNDGLFATGTSGGEMFQKFFAEFNFRLQLEHRTANVAELIADSTRVHDIADYCETLVRC